MACNPLDSSGKVTFTTIFPGCYVGCYPHIHTAAQIAAQTIALSGSADAGYNGSIVVGVPW